MNATGRPIRSESIHPGQSFGKFYLVQTIGEGGTSKIFKALQQPINRLVALKIPSFPDAGKLLTPDEFLAEATLMARLEHGNIVRIYDFGVSEDRAFICMEFVEGQNLQEIVESRGPLPLSATVALGIQLLDGLNYAHSQGVLHLDLSPANALLARTGVAKLLDFGMAGKKPQPASGLVMGTPAFLSPEHALGQAGTTQSDIFSFASLLFYAAAGEPLFDAGVGNTDLAGMLSAIGSARENPPEDRLRRLGGPLSRIVSAALRGADANSTAKLLKDLWHKLEDDARPEAVLRRELGWEIALTHSEGESKTSSDGELKDRFLKLRSQGKHREAMALLESALRRHPENPALRDLLMVPPEKVKSIPATMAMESAATGETQPSRSGIDKRALPQRHRNRKAVKVGMTVGIVAITVSSLGWIGSRYSKPADPSLRPETHASTTVKVPAKSPVAPVPTNAGASPATTSEPVKEPDAVDRKIITPQPEKEIVPGASAGNERNEIPTAITPAPTRTNRHEGAAPKRKPQSGEIAAGPSQPQAIPTGDKKISGQETLPPALTVLGPMGTRISVDDGEEWTVPAPREGWPLTPGLINISLRLPGSARPITSSLFVSADSLYVLKVEDDGGFSLSRRAR